MNMKSYNYMKVSELNLENRKLCEKMRETLMKPRDILQTGQTLKSGKKNVGIEIFPAKQESEMGKVAEKKLGKESADVVKEIEKADFPMYPVLKVNTTQTESWMEDDKADRIKAEELKIFTQKDCLLKIVSLIVGEKSKQLLKPGSKLRMLLEQHLAPLLLSDPEFILKVSLYCRRELNLRLVSNFLLAYAAANKNTAGFLKKYFKMAVRLPSDWLQVASIELGMDTNLKRGNVPMALRRVLVNKFTDFDEYQLAKYNKSPKIGEEEEDIKDREFSMKRLVRTLHIHEPADLVMKLLGKRYPEDRERFRECRLPGQFKPQLAGKRMKLETPETWETMISAYPGNKSEVWEHLIENRKLPYTATIRNIRNLLLTGVSDEYLKKAADFISNKIMVEKGGMFPFQYFCFRRDVSVPIFLRDVSVPIFLFQEGCFRSYIYYILSIL
ncbi:telomerase protein component 1 [Eurytemora carolleeae]|uniref:telomerase protein component 1 n=1 Tax=Eurytemora carolleeae TaxID=1294199 RepID=UPI000C7801F1|nr:telomerase protein component 1 [Eurytemora carolleeae]|eukprot:XP_023330833.1 telomerase protein component 1-like [Eurytemora affinis]